MATKQYDTIKRNFKAGLWPESAVYMAVGLKRITAEQFKEITGKEYVAEVKA